MLKAILLEAPGVVKTADEIQTNSDWKALTEEAGQQGIRVILFSFDASSKKQCCTQGELSGEHLRWECLEEKYRPTECLLLAADSECLSAARKLGIPCVAYGEDVPAFQTKYQISTSEGAEFWYLKQIYQRLSGEEVVIAETGRLMIREMTQEDAEAMWEIQNQGEVRRYTEGISHDCQTELEKHRAYVEHVYPLYGYGLWAVCLKASRKLIGRCGIQDREYNGVCEIELGYLLDTKDWGQGYATEAVSAVIDYAFHQLGIEQIVAWIEPENERSVRVAQKTGMEFCEYRIKNGKNFACYKISRQSD